jgi:hypothetical protein
MIDNFSLFSPMTTVLHIFDGTFSGVCSLQFKYDHDNFSQMISFEGNEKNVERESLI